MTRDGRSTGTRSRLPVTLVYGLVAAGGLGVLLAVLVLASPGLGVSLLPPEFARPLAAVAILSGLVLASSGLGLAVFWPVVTGRAATDSGSHRVLLSTTAFATLVSALLSNVLPLLLPG